MLAAFGRAFRLLTVFPIGRASETEIDPASVAAWFPTAGLVVGMLAWLASAPFTLFAPLSKWGFIPAIVVLVTIALVTRLMHWDAIADVADAWWGGYTPERRREIASDSLTGAFGVAAVVLVALMEFALLERTLSAGLAFMLPAVFFLSRLSATSASWLGTPAKKEGLGRSVMGRPGTPDVACLSATLITTVALTCAVSSNPVSTLVVLVLLTGISFAMPHLVAPRFGGMTGDVMGASILLTELLGLAFVFFYGGIL